MRLFSRHLSRLSRRAQLESAGGVTQFAEVLRLVKQTPDVVDLGQGFPDFEGNQVARDVAHFAVGSDVRLNQYTPPSGLPALHEAIASFNGRRWREELEPGVQTLVTAGGTEAIFSALPRSGGLIRLPPDCARSTPPPGVGVLPARSVT